MFKKPTTMKMSNKFKRMFKRNKKEADDEKDSLQEVTYFDVDLGKEKPVLIPSHMKIIRSTPVKSELKNVTYYDYDHQKERIAQVPSRMNIIPYEINNNYNKPIISPTKSVTYFDQDLGRERYAQVPSRLNVIPYEVRNVHEKSANNNFFDFLYDTDTDTDDTDEDSINTEFTSENFKDDIINRYQNTPTTNTLNTISSLDTITTVDTSDSNTSWYNDPRNTKSP